MTEGVKFQFVADNPCGCPYDFIFQFVADDAHIVQRAKIMDHAGFTVGRGLAPAVLDLLKIYRLTVYSPAVNWFVGDAKPYESAVNLCVIGRQP